jgi:microcin C transport system ATP-binding protein
MTLLAVDKLSLSFGAFEAVKHISFQINKGEMFAIVGESGSGKSLTALSCLGLQPDSARISGSIKFNGQELVGASESTLRQIRGARISMIFQEPMTALNPLHTLDKQLSEIILLHQRLRPDPLRARIEELLEQVGLAHFKDRLDAYPHQLSGGERQRVMIAMAIANGPDLLIADEPTTAVDVTIQAKILKLLKRLQAELGMAILFITHDLTVVRRLADRVAVMSHGEMVEQGKVADIFSRPTHPYTQHLLASEPKGEAIPLPANPAIMMECENLKVHFPIKKGLLQRVAGYVKAVDGVSVAIPESSTLGVVGESGSGKTTLGFALLRLLKSQGRIVFLGQDIEKLMGSQMRPLRERMQVVFQDPYSSLNPRMNVRAIIEEGLLVHHRDKSEAERLAEIDTILTDVGLTPDIKERFPHEFSGGQRQRISIARAMVLRPKFVVLDEPTSALDLSVQSQIIELLRNLQKKYGLSYMFISHDLRVVKAIAHRIIVMHRGIVVEQGDSKTIFAAPQHAYTKALIDAAFMKAAV